MTFVIGPACIDVMDQSCVEACPVDCIEQNEGDRQFFIHPVVCIECNACEPVCPVEAIRRDTEVPDEWKEYTQINADHPFKERV